MRKHHPGQAGNVARQRRMLVRPLPQVPIEQLAGVIRILAGKPRYSHWKLPDLHDLLKLDMGHFLLLIEAATILAFAQVHEGTITLTLMGRAYAFSNTRTRKHIFAEHLLSRIPLVTDIHHVLVTQGERCAPKKHILKNLERDLGRLEAQRTLETIIDWGRYAGVFRYNDSLDLLSLEDTADHQSCV